MSINGWFFTNDVISRLSLSEKVYIKVKLRIKKFLNKIKQFPY